MVRERMVTMATEVAIVVALEIDRKKMEKEVTS